MEVLNSIITTCDSQACRVQRFGGAMGSMRIAHTARESGVLRLRDLMCTDELLPDPLHLPSSSMPITWPRSGPAESAVHPCPQGTLARLCRPAGEVLREGGEERQGAQQRTPQWKRTDGLHPSSHHLPALPCLCSPQVASCSFLPVPCCSPSEHPLEGLRVHRRRAA